MIQKQNTFKYDNPFYDNHFFTKADLDRVKIKWWEYPILWFLPMKVQITEEGVWYFKVWDGAYYFMKFDSLPPQKEEDNE